ncbi:hypothetical protein [Sphingobium chlorophenolicum]|uniref:hypothetical protein n=1 Tax=Sphingobium chlorophenolicum TaxID=46429 RepID=UPI00117E6E67|nr:hypothetical protein [Sphingobium chlorophenolicum]
MTRVALDANILAYLAGVGRDARDDAKIEVMRNLIGRLTHWKSAAFARRTPMIAVTVPVPVPRS